MIHGGKKPQNFKDYFFPPRQLILSFHVDYGLWSSSGYHLHYKSLFLSLFFFSVMYNLLNWRSRWTSENGLLLSQVNLAFVEAADFVSEPVNREPPSREAQILTLKNTSEFDVLVIGGGATGCGCALDAVTRGESWCGWM